MSTVSIANVEQDVALALLDLQSNVRDTSANKRKQQASGSTDDMESTSKFILSCLITSQLQPTPMNTNKDPIPNSKKSLPTTSKRSQIFKQKPTKISNTSYADLQHDRPDININKKPKTCDASTQTDEDPHTHTIATMEFVVKRLCTKIKALEGQIKMNAELLKSMEKVTSEDDEEIDNNDVTFKTNSHSNEDTHMDESMAYSDDDTSENYTPSVKSKAVRDVKANKLAKNQNHANKVARNQNHEENGDDMVPLGKGSVMISATVLRHINWNSYTSATRKLLTTVFSRRVLATHSLTGKRSPAFPNKPAKKKLDSALVNDIVKTVATRCRVAESAVRTSITTKCADESKMYRTRRINHNKRRKSNRENVSPDETDTD